MGRKSMRKGLTIAHIIISLICSCLYFGQLMPNVGSENIACNYLNFGKDLSWDGLSRGLCLVWSWALAFVFIWFLWKALFKLAQLIKDKKWSAYFEAFFIVLGIALILCLYPQMFGTETTDDYMNLVYAMEFLPMYWHGFWTNVVYCACMIVFPHPVSIPIIQFLFAMYVIHFAISELAGFLPKDRSTMHCVMSAFLLLPLLPEIIRIFFYPTRNCMYAIPCVYVILVLYVDYWNKRCLTLSKFLLLSILFAFLGSWRGEGIIYLFAFPLLIWVVYFGERTDNLIKDKKLICKLLLFYAAICILLLLPDKYGVARYQNSDYMIANTTGPLSATFKNEDANLFYKGAEKDLENINAVIPLEYIEKYGCNAGFYYNAASGRFVRQSGVDKEEGGTYVNSALRVMLYNLPIWVKYQVNMFMSANEIGFFRFKVDYGRETLENWAELQAYIRAFELYDCGESFLEEYEITGVDSQDVSGVLNNLYMVVRQKFAWYKVALVLGAIVCSVVAAIKRDWLSVLLMLLNLAVLCVIVLMAPWSRPNYYYSVFINMSILIVLFFFGHDGRVHRK